MKIMQTIQREISGQAGRGNSVGLAECGELTELLAKPQQTRCPHCNKLQPPPVLRTRKRRLYALHSASGAVLHLEIDP